MKKLEVNMKIFAELENDQLKELMFEVDEESARSLIVIAKKLMPGRSWDVKEATSHEVDEEIIPVEDPDDDYAGEDGK